MTKTSDTYESIDEGAPTDNFDEVLGRVITFSKLPEPDIKERLSIEKALAKYLSCTAQSAMLALNFMLTISSQYETNNGHKSEKESDTEST